MRQRSPPGGGEKWGEKSPKQRNVARSGKFADKPGSVGHPAGYRATIPLGDPLPSRSSSLPGSGTSHAVAPLFGLAPDGVYRATAVASRAVGSYPTLSPLPGIRCRRRYPFCCRQSPPRVTPPARPVRIDVLCGSPLRATLSVAFGLATYGARRLAGILLFGARTFLDPWAAVAWRTSRRRLSRKPADSASGRGHTEQSAGPARLTALGEPAPPTTNRATTSSAGRPGRAPDGDGTARCRGSSRHRHCPASPGAGPAVATVRRRVA